MKEVVLGVVIILIGLVMSVAMYSLEVNSIQAHALSGIVMGIGAFVLVLGIYIELTE